MLCVRLHLQVTENSAQTGLGKMSVPFWGVQGKGRFQICCDPGLKQCPWDPVTFPSNSSSFVGSIFRQVLRSWYQNDYGIFSNILLSFLVVPIKSQESF